MDERYLMLCGRVPSDNPENLLTQGFEIHGPSPGRNIHVHYGQITEFFFGQINRRLLDLIAIAAYVYTGDQAVSRDSPRDSYGVCWRRHLHYRIEVSDLAFWTQPIIRRLLAELLGFLSDDFYHFEFFPSRELCWQPKIEICKMFYPEFDDVVLFSGGLDSLAGAVEYGIGMNRRLLMVKHDSNPKNREAHLNLATDLISRMPRDGHFVPVKVNKDKEIRAESIQRTRSFLFGCLAIPMAAAFEKDRLLFFENGMVSINLPVLTQVVGGRASRTTHPKVLRLMGHLFSHVLERPFRVENPFQFKTKTEIVETIAQHGCQEFVQRTTSCAKPRLASEVHPHCGVCSQCIDRQFAILAAQQAHSEDWSHYAVELFQGTRADDIDLTFAVAYYSMAQRIQSMTSLREFVSSYGELSRVLESVPERNFAWARRSRSTSQEAPEVILKQIFEMHQRHARVVIEQVRAAYARNSQEIIDRQVPDRSLLSAVANQPISEDRPTPEPPMPENMFRYTGSQFQIRFQGGGVFEIPISVGAFYTRQMLDDPEKSFTPAQLESDHLLFNGDEREFIKPESETKVSDNEALRSCFIRLAEIREELTEANQQMDLLRAEELAREQGLINDNVRESLTPTGISKSLQSEQDKCRKRVSNAITRCIKKIRQRSPELANHLEACLHLGSSCRYTPETEVIWST